MSDWSNIPNQKLSSDMPDEFIGAVTKVEQSVNKSGYPVYLIHISTVDGTDLVMTIKKPKAWTGKGQADKLRECLEKLGLKDGPADMVGKAFRWKRMELEGSMKGFARHYPIAEVKGKLTR